MTLAFDGTNRDQLLFASRFDTWRLARGLDPRALDWALGTRVGTEMMDLPLARIRYRMAGNGSRTIVFVADPPNVIEHYDRLIELLAPSFRVICLDMPGFGFSYPKAGFTFAINDQVEVLSQFLERLGYGPYYLAFSCGGAIAAVGLATQCPDLVAGVINIQAASWDEQTSWAQRVDLMGIVGTPIFGQLLLASAPNWIAQKWYDVALPSQDMATEFSRIGKESLRHGACFCLASGLQQLQSNAEVPMLRAVTQPSMVVWGTADRTHRRTDRHSARKYFPDAGWHEFEHAGHFPELEMPERFAAAVRDFVVFA